jgi:hypothetical protein
VVHGRPRGGIQCHEGVAVAIAVGLGQRLAEVGAAHEAPLARVARLDDDEVAGVAPCGFAGGLRSLGSGL